MVQEVLLHMMCQRTTDMLNDSEPKLGYKMAVLILELAACTDHRKSHNRAAFAYSEANMCHNCCWQAHTTRALGLLPPALHSLQEGHKTKQNMLHKGRKPQHSGHRRCWYMLHSLTTGSVNMSHQVQRRLTGIEPLLVLCTLTLSTTPYACSCVCRV